jgi:hypothetical protein
MKKTIVRMILATFLLLASGVSALADGWPALLAEALRCEVGCSR